MIKVGDSDVDQLRKASDVYLASAFLHLLCYPDNMDIGLAFMVNDASEGRKAAVIDELTKIGAIERVNSTWQATEKGRVINTKLSRAIERRF